MLLLRRARVPAALLPPMMAAGAVDPLDPAVLCDLRIAGDRITAVAPSGPPANDVPDETIDLRGELVSGVCGCARPPRQGAHLDPGAEPKRNL